jgi:hypothetical protein
MTLVLPFHLFFDCRDNGKSIFYDLDRLDSIYNIDKIAKKLCSIQDLQLMNREFRQLSVDLQRLKLLNLHGSNLYEEVLSNLSRYLRWIYLFSIIHYHTARKLIDCHLQASLPVELVEMIKKNVRMEMYPNVKFYQWKKMDPYCSFSRGQSVKFTDVPKHTRHARNVQN